MSDNQEFLSPHQCFIIYDDMSKKIALSIRNRLSAKGIKCTVWDEKHFRDNEFRMSNYNRILFLNKKIADEYLANPQIIKEISDYVLYKREGRVASLTLANQKVKYNEILKEVETKYNEMKKKLSESADKEEMNASLAELTPGEIADSFQLALQPSTPMLPSPSGQETSVKINRFDKFVDLALLIGINAAFPVATASISVAMLCYAKYDDLKSSAKCKEILLFAAALEFEKNLINDFINAE